MRLGKQVRGVRQMFHGVIFVQLESRIAFLYPGCWLY
jgi:hypothetical protein